MTVFAARLEALVQEVKQVVTLSPRRDFVTAEVGVSFEGKMIYSREKLAACFAARDGMSIEDAHEWIDFNIISTDQVLVID